MRHALTVTMLLSAAQMAMAHSDGLPPAFPGEPVNSRALDSEALQRLGVTLAGTELGRVPNMAAVISPGGNANRIYLRGLGSSDPLDSQPVATIVNSVPLPTGIANSFILFDPQLLSISSGPFGTASGPQGLAGVVSIRNQAPGDRLGGFVEAGFGSEARWLLRGSVDLPFDELVAFKLSAYWQGDHGFARNLTTGERVNDGDMSGVRLAVRLQPAAGLGWNLAAAYTENNGENLLNFPCADAGVAGCTRYLTTGMTTAPRLGGGPQYGVPINGRKAGFALGSEVKTLLLSSRLAWEADNWRLLGVTAYVDTAARQALDFGDGRPVPGPNSPVHGYVNGGYTLLHDGNYRQFSQELRATGSFGPLSLTAGGWYSNRTNRTDAATIQTFDNGTPAGAPAVLADAISNDKTRELAGFAQAAFTQGPFEAVAGIRYSDLQQGRGGQTVTNRLWTPSAELAVQPFAASRIFVRASKGFVAGRFTDPRPFTVSSGWTYEAGATTSLAADRLHLAITGFALDVDHVRTADWLGPPQPLARLKNHGAEAELTARPINHMAVWANIGWQSASYQDAPGLTPVYAPKFTAAGGGYYDLPIAYAGVLLTPTIELRYRDAMATDRQTLAGSAVQANLSLAVRTDDENWMLALECRNCLNADNIDSSLLGWAYRVTPRTWMLRARRNF